MVSEVVIDEVFLDTQLFGETFVGVVPPASIGEHKCYCGSLAYSMCPLALRGVSAIDLPTDNLDAASTANSE